MCNKIVRVAPIFGCARSHQLFGSDREDRAGWVTDFFEAGANNLSKIEGKIPVEELEYLNPIEKQSNQVILVIWQVSDHSDRCQSD